MAEAWQMERMAVDENGKGLERPKKRVKGIKQGVNNLVHSLEKSLWL